MKTKHIIAVFLGALVAFLWSSISWMAIPWHQPTMEGFKDEDSIGQAIKGAAAEPGIYTYPAWTEDEEAMQKKHDAGPFVFAAVVPKGVGSDMTQMMIRGFLVDMVGAALLLMLMLSAGDTGWKARALVGCMAAVFVSVVPALMYWTWWHFPIGFTLVGIADGIIGWSLAGLAMAKLTSGRAPANA